MDTRAKPNIVTHLSRWWEPYRSPFVQVLLLVLWVGILALAAWRMLTDVPSVPAASSIQPPSPLVGDALESYRKAVIEKALDTELRGRLTVAFVTCVSALPKILCFIASLLVQRGLNQRREDAARMRSQPAFFEPDLKWTNTVAAQWTQEDQRADDLLRARVTQYAGLYGFVCSVSLALCSTGLLYRFFLSPTEEGPLAFSGALAAAVGAATLVSFARDFGRLLVRSARRDVSIQFLASTTRKLLLTLLFAAFAAGVALVTKIGVDAAGLANLKLESLPVAAVLGAVVAIGGEGTIQAITERAMAAFGLPKPRTPPPGLEELKGLREDDMERLAEEGIDSVHALAFYSTPRLYFVSRYSLERICDWQDQALLIVRVGLDRARLLRDQLGVGGAIDSMVLATRLLSSCKEESDGTMKRGAHWEDVRKLLGFATDVQAEVAFRRLSEDSVAERLRHHRAMVPDGTTEAEERTHKALTASALATKGETQ